jgi:hypothetical protein
MTFPEVELSKRETPRLSFAGTLMANDFAPTGRLSGYQRFDLNNMGYPTAPQTEAPTVPTLPSEGLNFDPFHRIPQ